jgi:hypothetical protein
LKASTLTFSTSSSLARIESTTKVVEANIIEIKDYIQVSVAQQSEKFTKVPVLSAKVDSGDAICLAIINAGLMKHAENFQPWSSIGIDRWIHAGWWWLLKVSPLSLRSKPVIRGLLSQ